jgi:hypothetical protein
MTPDKYNLLISFISLTTVCGIAFILGHVYLAKESSKDKNIGFGFVVISVTVFIYFFLDLLVRL